MSKSIEAITPKAELLLTSAGPTTEVIQERLLEIGRNTGRLHDLTVLRIADGWTAFSPEDGVSKRKRAEQRIERLMASSWSSKYIEHVLIGSTVVTHAVGSLPESIASNLLEHADMILVPGGNTYQTIRGISLHQEMLRKVIGEGKPFIGESAGSIIAGQSTKPATLEPEDTLPIDIRTNLNEALGLINVDVVVHASGRTEGFAIPGVKSMIASSVLKGYETPQEAVKQFRAQRQEEADIATIALNDVQALSVSSNIFTLL